jgi:hypothetical protein
MIVSRKNTGWPFLRRVIVSCQRARDAKKMFFVGESHPNHRKQRSVLPEVNPFAAHANPKIGFGGRFIAPGKANSTSCLRNESEF